MIVVVVASHHRLAVLLLHAAALAFAASEASHPILHNIPPNNATVEKSPDPIPASVRHFRNDPVRIAPATIASRTTANAATTIVVSLVTLLANWTAGDDAAASIVFLVVDSFALAAVFVESGDVVAPVLALDLPHPQILDSQITITKRHHRSSHHSILPFHAN